jgi:hypothetical protein
MQIIRDEHQNGKDRPEISMMPLLTQWHIKRCNIAGCQNQPTTIIAGIKGVPTFGMCENHYQQANRPEGSNITIEI